MKIENMKKAELVQACKKVGIETNKKNAKELSSALIAYNKAEIETAIKIGNGLELLKTKIKVLSDEYAENLKRKINERHLEMQKDDNSHYLIYRVLGIPEKEGALIDKYQNTGRFLYKYAGSFLEESASLCLLFSNSRGGKKIIKNTQGQNPKNFEIDFVNENDAIELKWRDATTDGDHITKEHTRVKVIRAHGYNPIRVMFYSPQREQAIKIQEALKAIYASVDGEYYAGDEAWEYLKKTSHYDLKSILTEVAETK